VQVQVQVQALAQRLLVHKSKGDYLVHRLLVNSLLLNQTLLHTNLFHQH
jgi:hypothetical protein